MVLCAWLCPEMFIRCAAATGRRGPYGAVKRGGFRIFGDTVNTAREDKLRQKSIALIFNWIAREGFDEQQPDDGSTVLPLLGQFVQSAFDLGAVSLCPVRAALEGLGEKKCHLLQPLKPVWLVVSSWERGKPVEMCTPMPFSAWRTIFAASVIWRWVAFGVLLAIGFHCLLEPGGYIAAVRNAFEPKPGTRIFLFTFTCFLARWNKLLNALSFPRAWTPSSLQAGGTTHYYRSGAYLRWIRLRGRRRVATSLTHYVQEAVAWLLQNELSEKTKHEIKHRSDNCWYLYEHRPLSCMICSITARTPVTHHRYISNTPNQTTTAA